MTKRSFFVALGVPRGAKPEAIQTAYRRVVTRYRRELEQESLRPESPEEDPTEPPVGRFAVMQSYSQRRHNALFHEPEQEPAIPAQKPVSEVDRFYGGFVPEAMTPARARREGKDLFVELRLSSTEAGRGGLFPIHIPIICRCPRCLDWDEDQRVACHHCKGNGQVLEDRMVEVTVPPGVQHNHTVRLAMEDVGMDDTDLIIRVLVNTLLR